MLCLWLQWQYLAEDGGVLAGMSLKQCPVQLACPERQPRVPWYGDLHLILEVPGKDAVAMEIVSMVHGWKGKQEHEAGGALEQCEEH